VQHKEHAYRRMSRYIHPLNRRTPHVVACLDAHNTSSCSKGMLVNRASDPSAPPPFAWRMNENGCMQTIWQLPDFILSNWNSMYSDPLLGSKI
jgi:hypothetical protein